MSESEQELYMEWEALKTKKLQEWAAFDEKMIEKIGVENPSLDREKLETFLKVQEPEDEELIQEALTFPNFWRFIDLRNSFIESLDEEEVTALAEYSDPDASQSEEEQTEWSKFAHEEFLKDELNKIDMRRTIAEERRFCLFLLKTFYEDRDDFETDFLKQIKRNFMARMGLHLLKRGVAIPRDWQFLFNEEDILLADPTGREMVDTLFRLALSRQEKNPDDDSPVDLNEKRFLKKLKKVMYKRDVDMFPGGPRAQEELEKIQEAYPVDPTLFVEKYFAASKGKIDIFKD